MLNTSRLHSATRLFRVIQDVCSEGFTVDGRQWKTNTVEVFQAFFSLLWCDPKVRLDELTSWPLLTVLVHRKKYGW